MSLFCVLALVLGAVLATAVSVIYLAVGLIVLTVAGAIEAYWIGVPLGKVLLWAIALFAIAQVGYVAGAAILALFPPSRRDPASNPILEDRLEPRAHRQPR
jgi:predicted MFS family arabinose efflux permease